MEERGKYEKIVRLLKDSKPVLNDPGMIAGKIISAIGEERARGSLTEKIIEYLFGWVYVGWVIRSMISVTMVIVLIFGYQQTVIMKRIKELSVQRIETSGLPVIRAGDNLSGRLLFFRLTGKKIPDDDPARMLDDIDAMIGSLNSLRIKYGDVIERIEKDPQLKKYVEERMNELSKKESKTR
jgi:hypothetical protein